MAGAGIQNYYTVGWGDGYAYDRDKYIKKDRRNVRWDDCVYEANRYEAVSIVR
jgi:hypothetical protein